MIESNVRDEAALLVLGWGSILAKPGGAGGYLLDKSVPAVDEDADHLALDVGLLVCVRSNSHSRRPIDSRITKGRGSSPALPLACVPLKGDQCAPHLLNNEFDLLLIALGPFLRFTPFDPESVMEIRVVQVDGC